MAEVTISKDLGIADRPEYLLLLYCAHTQLDNDREAAIQQLCNQSIDWHRVLHLAEQHGIIPLLNQTLNRACPEFVPEPVLKHLKLYCNINAVRNRVLTTELLDILELLKANHIPAIPYKGPALAEIAYCDLTLRQFSDLDILVKKQDVLKTKHLLCANGYQPYTPLTVSKEEHLLKTSYQYKFTRTDAKVNLLELHWQVARSYPTSMNQFNPFEIDLASIWEQLETIEILNQPAPSFSPQTLFVLLCIHGAKDRWRSLKSLCDLNELIRAYPEVNLNLALETATNPEQYKVLSLALMLLKNLFNTPIPAEVLHRIRLKSVTQLATQVQQNLFSETSSHWSDRLTWQLKLIEGWQKRIKYTVWFTASSLLQKLS
jgi:hypothetical protein